MTVEFVGRLPGRIWRGLLRRAGPFGLFEIVTLQFCMVVAIQGLAGVVRGLGDFDGRFFIVALAGILLGRRCSSGIPVLQTTPWAAARAEIEFNAARRALAGRIRNALQLAFWAAAALPLLYLVSGNLLPEAWDVLRESYLRFGAALANGYRRELAAQLPPPEALLSAWSRFSYGAWLLFDDLRSWFAGLSQGAPVYRAGAVSFLAGSAFWWLALWAGAMQRRTGVAWIALFPAGGLTAAALAYSRSERYEWLVLFLLSVFILQAAGIQRENERRWALQRLDYPDGLRLDFSFTAMILTVLLAGSAYVAPKVDLVSAYREVFGPEPLVEPGAGDALGESLGIPRPTPLPPFFSEFARSGLPRSHLLGAAPELSTEVVLTVRVSGPAAAGRSRYYWRSLAYAIYDGHGWHAGDTRSVRYQAGTRLELEMPENTRVLRQEVAFAGLPDGLAYAAGGIVSLDRGFEVAWHAAFGDVLDPFGVHLDAASYTVDSVYPWILEDRLRAAGGEMPDWVSARYLQLPPLLPQRVRDLAAEITSGKESPFDRARALETYLRGFPYSLEVGLPPAERDVVDYFLFDLQTGYCDYYASAMVVLARAAGLPARLAAGYAQGLYDPEQDAYVVLGLDAHSWPEVYFPGFGWVPFEPTAGLAAIDWAELSALPGPSPADLPPLTAPALTFGGVLLRGLGILFGLAALTLALWALVDAVRLVRQPAEAFYQGIFQRLFAYSRARRVVLPVRATPNELSASLMAYLGPRFDRSALMQKLPGSAQDLSILREHYNRLLFSPEMLPAADKRAGLKAWRRLRTKIWLVR